MTTRDEDPPTPVVDLPLNIMPPSSTLSSIMSSSIPTTATSPGLVLIRQDNTQNLGKDAFLVAENNVLTKQLANLQRDSNAKMRQLSDENNDLKEAVTQLKARLGLYEENMKILASSPGEKSGPAIIDSPVQRNGVSSPASRILNIKNENVRMRKRIDDLNSAIRKLTTELDNRSTKIDQLTEENGSLRAQLSQYTGSKLADTLEKVTALIAPLEIEAAPPSSLLNENAIITTLITTNKKLQKQIEQLSKSSANDSNNSKLFSDLQTNLDAKNTSLAKLEEENNALKRELLVYRSWVEQSSTMSRTFQDTYSSFKQYIEASEAEKARYRHDLGLAEMRLLEELKFTQTLNRRNK